MGYKDSIKVQVTKSRFISYLHYTILLLYSTITTEKIDVLLHPYSRLSVGDTIYTVVAAYSNNTWYLYCNVVLATRLFVNHILYTYEKFGEMVRKLENK